MEDKKLLRKHKILYMLLMVLYLCIMYEVNYIKHLENEKNIFISYAHFATILNSFYIWIPISNDTMRESLKLGS